MTHLSRCVIWCTILCLAAPLVCSAIHPLEVKDNVVPSAVGNISASLGSTKSVESVLIPSVGPTGNNILSRIIGGSDAREGDIPWQVGLRQETVDFLFCGGTLLSSRVVVTAAHCFNVQNDFFVGMGGLKTSSFPIKVQPANIIVHEGYSSGAYPPKHDIALIILDKDVSFSQNVRAAALPWYDEDKNTRGIISGWGYVDNNGNAAEILQVADVNLWDQDDCESAYQNDGNQVTEDMLCAGYYDYSRDACTGDSGGPLIVQKDSYDILVGITSWGPGDGCAKEGFPGVYTRVTSYIDWIRNQACSAGHCIPTIMTSSTVPQKSTTSGTVTSAYVNALVMVLACFVSVIWM